jgi:hypothetical protein
MTNRFQVIPVLFEDMASWLLRVREGDRPADHRRVMSTIAARVIAMMAAMAVTSAE